MRIEYYEPYETYVHATYTRSVPCGSDGKGNTTYCTEIYDCSYCDDISASYYAVTQIGEKHPISSYNYERLVKKFKTTPYFVELNRNINYHSGCGKDGDSYFCDWNG